MKNKIFAMSLWLLGSTVVSTASNGQDSLPLFAPSDQRPVHAQSGGTIVTLAQVELCKDCDSGRQFDVAIKRSSVGNSSLTIKNLTAQIDSFRFLSPTRLAVIGRANSNLVVISIADLKLGKVVDQVVGYEPVFSPSGKYVAFVKFYPKVTDAQTSSNVYIIYDVLKTNATAENDSLYMGRPIYPMVNLQTKSYNPQLASSRIHLMWRGFQWINNQVVTFVDSWGSELDKVTVDLTDGLKNPSVTSVRQTPPPATPAPPTRH